MTCSHMSTVLSFKKTHTLLHMVRHLSVWFPGCSCWNDTLTLMFIPTHIEWVKSSGCRQVVKKASGHLPSCLDRQNIPRFIWTHWGRLSSNYANNVQVASVKRANLQMYIEQVQTDKACWQGTSFTLSHVGREWVHRERVVFLCFLWRVTADWICWHGN